MPELLMGLQKLTPCWTDPRGCCAGAHGMRLEEPAATDAPPMRHGPALEASAAAKWRPWWQSERRQMRASGERPDLPFLALVGQSTRGSIGFACLLCAERQCKLQMPRKATCSGPPLNASRASAVGVCFCLCLRKLSAPLCLVVCHPPADAACVNIAAGPVNHVPICRATSFRAGDHARHFPQELGVQRMVRLVRQHVALGHAAVARGGQER